VPRGGGSALPALSLVLSSAAEVGPPDGLQQLEKWISVFINTTQGRSSKKRGWLKAFSIFLTAQGEA